MLSKFGKEPKFWNDFATNELNNELNGTQKFKIKYELILTEIMQCY